MLGQPPPGEGAPRHEREAFGPRSRDRGAHEHPTEATAPERVGDLGVDQRQSSRIAAIDELGDLAVELDDEAPGRLIVPDLDAGSVFIGSVHPENVAAPKFSPGHVDSRGCRSSSE